MNFFYSHTYLMAGYFDPLLVTGLQLGVRGGRQLDARRRAQPRLDDVRRPTGDMNFLGGIRWVSDDKRANLSSMVDLGSQPSFTGPQNDRSSWISTFGYKLSECLNYGAQYTIGQEVNGSTSNPAICLLVRHQPIPLLHAVPEMSAGVRYEWVRDEDGSRIAGIGNRPSTTDGWKGLPGFTGSFHDLSLGLNYRPHPNFVLRPRRAGTGTMGHRIPAISCRSTSMPKHGMFTAAMDLIVTF